MNVENVILSFIFNICNWVMLPMENHARKNFKNVIDEKDIPYSDKCPACKLDIHYQEKKPAQKRPALVNIHGGGLIIGDKKNSTYYCYEIAGKSDVIVFNINYGMPGKEVPAMFEGCDPVASHNDEWVFPLPIRTHMDALRFVAEHAEEYNIDLDNVFVSGDSAGSEMTGITMACFCSEEYRNALGVELPNFKPKGFIMNCGLYNMNIYKYIPIGRVMWVKFMGDKAPHKNALWKYHNPIPYINKDAGNAFVLKGMTDILTIFQSDWMAKKLKAEGVNTTYYIGKNPLDSFHDFMISPGKEATKALDATRTWILETAKK